MNKLGLTIGLLPAKSVI